MTDEEEPITCGRKGCDNPVRYIALDEKRKQFMRICEPCSKLLAPAGGNT